jgi:TonB family protein
MKILSIIFILLGVLSVFSYGQATPKLYTVHGTITDPAGAAIAGLQVAQPGGMFAPESVSDINGEFTIQLPAGDQVLIVEPAQFYDFKTVVKVAGKGPKADKLKFIVDMSRTCCTTAAGKPFPKPVSLQKAAYPAAALVVAAKGEVKVSVAIDRQGNVTSAKALNGHPLLRAAAVAGARASKFEPADTDDREARITYVFIDKVKLRDGTIRYTDPFRVDVIPGH